MFQSIVCHASTNNSVLDGITGEITGLLLSLGNLSGDTKVKLTGQETDHSESSQWLMLQWPSASREPCKSAFLSQDKGRSPSATPGTRRSTKKQQQPPPDFPSVHPPAQQRRFCPCSESRKDLMKVRVSTNFARQHHKSSVVVPTKLRVLALQTAGAP